MENNLLDNSVFDHNDLTEGKDARTQDDRAIDQVRKFMTQSQLYRRPHVELSVLSRELYECWRIESKSIIQRANLKLPYGYTIIESQIPEIIEGILHERPVVEMQGELPQHMLYENQLTDFMDSQLDEMRFPLKLVSFVKAMKLDGTAFAKVPYKYKEQVVTRRQNAQDPLTGMTFQVKKPQLEVLYDGPDFEHIPFLDFYPDWSVRLAGDIDSMRGVVHRTWKSLNDIKKNKKRKNKDGSTKGVYKNIDELERSVRIKGSGDGVAWKAPYYSDDFKDRLDRLSDNKSGIKDGDKIEVWEFWGIFDETGDGDFVEYIITIANGDVVLRCDDNFYDYKIKPFVAAPNVIRDGEFYGVPELLAIKGLIKESNTIRNSILDQINIGINQMFLVDRNSGINAKSLFSRPGGIVWANDINGMREIKQPEIPPQVFSSVQAIQGDIQAAVGQSNGPGAPSTFNTALARSATGAQYLQSFSASRAGLSLRILGETLLKPMYRIMFWTDRQFIDDHQWSRVTDPNQQAQPGNPFSFLPVDAFTFDYSFKLATKIETGGGQTDLQKMQLLAQMLQSAEQTQPGITNWPIVFETIGRDLVGSRFKKFIRSDAERMMIQQQQAMITATAQAAQAGMSAQATGELASNQAATQQAQMSGQSQPGNALIGQLAPQPNPMLGGMGTGR